MPDQAHKEYYEKNPCGNHMTPSPETKYRLDKQDVINDQIFSKLNDIEKLNVRQMDILERVEIQTTKTNGRVNVLEEWKTAYEKDFNEMLNDIKTERKEVRSKLREWGWEALRAVVISSATVIAGLLGAKEFFFK